MYSFKINNKKSLAIGIVFVCIFIALTVRLYVLMIHPTSTVQGELKNHQVEYSSDNNYKIFDTNGENLINYKNTKIILYINFNTIYSYHISIIIPFSFNHIFCSL